MENNVMSKVKSRRFLLNKLIAKKVEKKPSGVNIKVEQDTNYSILDSTTDKLEILVHTKVYVNPEALFSFEFEHIAEYKLDSSITEEEINDNIDRFIMPLANEVSFLVAQLTKEMVGNRIILPPTLSVSKSNSNK